jgi:hypothetical protein
MNRIYSYLQPPVASVIDCAAGPNRPSREGRPDVHEQQDMEPTAPSVKEFTAMYRAELARWTKVAKDAGLKGE